MDSPLVTPTRRPRRRPAAARPSLRVERALQRQGHRIVAGMDEVGRGALAGPVSVGVVLVDESCRSAPTGVRDSKLLPPKNRQLLVAPIRRWALAWAVGHAHPHEIDAMGIMAALRLAGNRALEQVRQAAAIVPDLVILDGKHDWLSDPMRCGLFEDAESPAGLMSRSEETSEPRVAQPVTAQPVVPVQTLIKADRSCSSVAAASILAKVERDDLMIALAARHPAYRWELNKGYAAPEHLAALTAYGPCVLHRRSWQLPGAAGPAGRIGDDVGVEGMEVSRT